MRAAHRSLAVLAVIAGLYIGLTGTFIQMIDLHAIFTGAPITDPDVAAIHDGEAGPANFQVLVNADYTAPDLPTGLDFSASLARVMASARAAGGKAPVSFVELRMVGGKPLGRVASAGHVLGIDPGSGAVLVGPGAAPPVMLPAGANASLRNAVKNIHRMTAYGNYGIFLFLLLAMLLGAMIFTGLVQHSRLLRAHGRPGSGARWFAGGGWRVLHRTVSFAAALFLSVVVITGIFEALGSAGISVDRMIHHGKRPGLVADVSSPLTDAELPRMLHATLASFTGLYPGTPLKILRLRYFAGMPQGVVVTGGADVRQVVINTATGGTASLTEPGYPFTGQTFGWQADQIVKKIHRGDFIGLGGRVMSLLTGLSLIFLSLSGGVMYFKMWKQRRRAGQTGLFWP